MLLLLCWCYPYIGSQLCTRHDCIVRAGSAFTCSAMLQYCLKMASKHGKESGACAFCSESNQKGTKILVVKGTAHTGMKAIHTKATVITFTSFGVGQFKKSLMKN